MIREFNYGSRQSTNDSGLSDRVSPEIDIIVTGHKDTESKTEDEHDEYDDHDEQGGSIGVSDSRGTRQNYRMLHNYVK